MLYGLFYMIDSLRGKNDPVKRLAEGFGLWKAGNDAKRKARNELSALKKPEYKP